MNIKFRFALLFVLVSGMLLLAAGSISAQQLRQLPPSGVSLTAKEAVTGLPDFSQPGQYFIYTKHLNMSSDKMLELYVQQPDGSTGYVNQLVADNEEWAVSDDCSMLGLPRFSEGLSSLDIIDLFTQQETTLQPAAGSLSSLVFSPGGYKLAVINSQLDSDQIIVWVGSRSYLEDNLMPAPLLTVGKRTTDIAYLQWLPSGDISYTVVNTILSATVISNIAADIARIATPEEYATVYVRPRLEFATIDEVKVDGYFCTVPEPAS